MAHFAELDENNIVTNVVVVNNESINPANEEETGIAFLLQITGHDRWKQTSYNSSIRKNYAGIGYSYDEARDAFIEPKPFESWVLNEETCQWNAPVQKPEGLAIYVWDETTTSWIEV
jgi:hypothetical protein